MTKRISTKMDKMREIIIEKMWNDYLKYSLSIPKKII